MSKRVVNITYLLIAGFSAALLFACANTQSQNSDAAGEAKIYAKDLDVAVPSLGLNDKLLRPEQTVKTKEGEMRSVIYYTKQYKVDRLYNSMQGPYSMTKIAMQDESKPPQLAWIKGIYSQVVDKNGQPTVSQQFMCHVNVNYDVAKHQANFGKRVRPRIVTLSQGQYYTEMPEGFGIPILTNEALDVDTMVLNHNFENQEFDLRHRIEFKYILDKDLKKPLQPLYQSLANARVFVDKGEASFGAFQGHDDPDAPVCLPGEDHTNLVTDQFGRSNSGHWVVNPGRQIHDSEVTADMNLRYDTVLHAADVHLHPWAESIELQDLTTGETVFKSAAIQADKGMGLKHVGVFRSAKGVKVYKDHKYGLKTIYNNPTLQKSDAMAVMYLHFLDKEFNKQKINSVVERKQDEFKLQNFSDDDKILLHTSLGTISIKPYPSLAKETVAQVKALAKAGAYDTTHVYRVEPGYMVQFSNVHHRLRPLNNAQRSVLKKIKGEFSSIKTRRGIVGMTRDANDPDSAESSFFILLNEAPHLEGKYTFFGEIDAGSNVLDAIENVARNSNNEPQQRLTVNRMQVIPANQASMQARDATDKGIPGMLADDEESQPSM